MKCYVCRIKIHADGDGKLVTDKDGNYVCADHGKKKGK